MGPEGLCPSFSVFHVIPRPTQSIPAPSQLQRAKVIEIAIEEVAKEPFQRKVAFGFRQTNGPKVIEHFSRLRRLPAESLLQVFRNKSEPWEEPFKFIHIEGKTVVVKTDHGRRMSPFSCIMSLITPARAEQILLATSSGGMKVPNAESTITEDERVPEELIPEGIISFADVRAEKIRGLIKIGTFQIVDRTSIGSDVLVFGSNVVDQIRSTYSGYR